MNDEYDFTLPILKMPPPPHRALTMDEYDRFVEDDLRDAFDRDAYMREKKLKEVHVPFRLW